jgi:ribosomal protein S24E
MNGKRIEISPHAGFEMRRRGISRSEVVAAIHHPGQIVPSRKGREIRQSLLGVRGRLLLRVVVRETATAYHVVTAYKTSKIAKYWITS